MRVQPGVRGLEPRRLTAWIAGILQGANAQLVANFIARNVAYVNSGPVPSIPASKVQCQAAPAGAPAKKPAPKKPAPAPRQ